MTPKETRACNSEDCNWTGATSRMLGTIGPLCPRCGETTEVVRRASPPSPYGHGSSYTPATDGCPVPFKPSADRYSPPASNAPKDQPQQPTTK